MRIFPELTLAAVVAGVGLGMWLNLPPASVWPLLLLAFAGLAIAIALRAFRVPAGPVLLVSALLLGAWRAVDVGPQELPIVPAGVATDIVVEVKDAPARSGNRVRFRGQASSDDSNAGSVPSGTNLLVYALPPSELVNQRNWPYLRYGDRVRVSGRWERPEPIGDFDYAAWLESQRIPAILWARETELVSAGRLASPTVALHRVRGHLASTLQRNIPVPQSGLAQALLLGVRADLPESLKAAFRSSGMSHLLAISGLHVGIVMAMALGLSSAVAGRSSATAFVFSGSVVWGYAVLSGLDPPVVRAAIMGSLVLAQGPLGRGMRTATALALAGGLMVGVQPGLLGNLSFQLSFTAMAGVIVALPIITTLTAASAASLSRSPAWGARWGHYGLALLIASAVISTTTTLATLPLIAIHFGEVPLMSVPATILAMPAMPAALVGAAATASLGQISEPLALVLGTATWGPLAWLTWVANNMPPASLPSDWLTPQIALAWYAGLALLVTSVSSRRARRLISGIRRRPQWRPGAVAGMSVGLAPVLAVSVLLLLAHWSGSRNDGMFHLYVLDVGQGDAILAVTADGRRMLVDGGPDPAAALAELSRLLPVGERTLDVVAATHFDADHVGGLIGVLDRYHARIVLHGSETSDSPLYPQWRQVLQRREHPVATVFAGHQIKLGSEVTLEVLHPPAGELPGRIEHNANNRSLVFLVRYRDVSFLLTGDIEQDVEKYLAEVVGSGLESDVLKVGHHGSGSSTSPVFLRQVNPQSAAISAGSNNRYGHPVEEVMERLKSEVGAGQLFLTAAHGTIEYVTDGENLWANIARTSEERKPP